MSRFITAFRYSLLRFIRNVPGMIMLLAMPLFIIPMLAVVFSWIPADTPYFKGAANPTTFFAVAMLLLFQLFGGTYSMESVRMMFLTPRRWRMHALPCRPTVMVMGTLAAATAISMMQGFLVMLFSHLFLGARFGSIGTAAAVLLGIALVSQLVGVTLLLAVRNTTAAFVLGWIVAYGSGVLGGVIFPLPENVPFFRFTQSYGTPFSLAQTALLSASRGGNEGQIALCIGMLFLLGVVLAGLSALLGRRKLA
jgi:ABC-2 type transport system permease protein